MTLWPEALHEIEEFTGSIGAVIDFIPRFDGVRPFTMAGRFTTEQCAEYAGNFQPVCRRIAFAVANQHVPVHFDSMIISESEMDRDPVYDWLAGHGLRYFIAGPMPSMRLHHVYFSLQRSPGQGHVEPKDIEQFNLLRPHIAKAVSLADTIGTFSANSQFQWAVLESLPQAIFALDGDGNVLFTNASADLLMRDGDALIVEGSKLLTCQRAVQSQLDGLIRTAVVPVGGVGGGWMALPRSSGRRDLAMFISHLSVGQDLPFNASPAVLVVVHIPERRVLIDPEVLQELYGLTAAEARVARALALGHSIDSAAADLTMSSATVRSHLKDVFRKMALNRQQDLVRVLSVLSFEAPRID